MDRITYLRKDKQLINMLVHIGKVRIVTNKINKHSLCPLN